MALIIDYYIEHKNTPPDGFIERMEQMLIDDYLPQCNSRVIRETMKQDITCYIQENWPLYPLGSVIVDALGAYDVNITVRMQDQIDEDEQADDSMNYECDYYIDMNEETAVQQTVQTVIPSADDVMFSPVTVTE